LLYFSRREWVPLTPRHHGTLTAWDIDERLKTWYNHIPHDNSVLSVLVAYIGGETMTDHRFPPFTALRLVARVPGVVELGLNEPERFGIDRGHVAFKGDLQEGQGNWSRLTDERTQVLVRTVMRFDEVSSISVSERTALIRHVPGEFPGGMAVRLQAGLAAAKLVGSDDIVDVFLPPFPTFDDLEMGMDVPRFGTDRGGVGVQISNQVFSDLSEEDLAALRELSERFRGRWLTWQNTPQGGVSPARFWMIISRDHIPTDRPDEE
jgi:hypothetical protein